MTVCFRSVKQMKIRSFWRKYFAAAILAAGFVAAHAQGCPLYLDESQPIDARVADSLPRLTPAEKISLCRAQSLFSEAGVPPLWMSVTLNRRAFAYYDADKANWVVDTGDYKIYVGSSLRNIHLNQTLHLQ